MRPIAALILRVRGMSLSRQYGRPWPTAGGDVLSPPLRGSKRLIPHMLGSGNNGGKQKVCD